MQTENFLEVQLQKKGACIRISKYTWAVHDSRTFSHE